MDPVVCVTFTGGTTGKSIEIILHKRHFPEGIRRIRNTVHSLFTKLYVLLAGLGGTRDTLFYTENLEAHKDTRPKSESFQGYNC